MCRRHVDATEGGCVALPASSRGVPREGRLQDRRGGAVPRRQRAFGTPVGRQGAFGRGFGTGHSSAFGASAQARRPPSRDGAVMAGTQSLRFRVCDQALDRPAGGGADPEAIGRADESPLRQRLADAQRHHAPDPRAGCAGTRRRRGPVVGVAGLAADRKKCQ